MIVVILLITGVLSFVQVNIGISFLSLTLLGAGAAFLLLYNSKKKGWSLVLGMYLVYIGLMSASGGVLPEYARRTAMIAMFFIIPGLLFLTQYVKKRRARLLYPASFLIWAGVYSVFSSFPFVGSMIPSLFFACLGGSFITIYFLSEYALGKANFYAGVIFIAIAVLQIINLTAVRTAGLVLIIAVGVAAIFYAVRKKRNDGEGPDNRGIGKRQGEN